MDPLATNSTALPIKVIYDLNSKQLCIKYTDGDLKKTISFKDMTEEEQSIYLAPQLDLIEADIVRLKSLDLIHENAVFDKKAVGEEMVYVEPEPEPEEGN